MLRVESYLCFRQDHVAKIREDSLVQGLKFTDETVPSFPWVWQIPKDAGWYVLAFTWSIQSMKQVAVILQTIPLDEFFKYSAICLEEKYDAELDGRLGVSVRLPHSQSWWEFQSES